jgi:hypothetical protein
MNQTFAMRVPCSVVAGILPDDGSTAIVASHRDELARVSADSTAALADQA